MNMTPIEDDEAWAGWRAQWRLREGTIYLNHGSFGPPPEPVRAARLRWLQEMDGQPMDFFCRQLEPAWTHAGDALARFVGTGPGNLVLVENATYGMNILANSLPLAAGDQVVLTDHEYGAVARIWRRACRQTGAEEPVIAELPEQIESGQQVVEAIFAPVTERTRLIVVSHITSPTALILPVQAICRTARERGVAVCVDGPHAPAQLLLDIDSLGCDFYTASCHKWLSAPFGCGFLYVAPSHQDAVRPPILSWGRLPPEPQRGWSDEFQWLGTRNPTSFLCIPDAIEFLARVGEDAFRRRTHFLAQYARRKLTELTGTTPLAPDSTNWYGSMVNVPLPDGDAKSLQEALWRRFRIEVPIISWKKHRSVRVSCHLYNRRDDIDRLVTALRELLC